MRAAGHVVVGIDSIEVPGLRERTDEFHKVDLEQGIPEHVGTGYDLIVAGDVIEHLSDPAQACKR